MNNKDAKIHVFKFSFREVVSLRQNLNYSTERVC